MKEQYVGEETILALERQIDLSKENIVELLEEFVKEADRLNEVIKSLKEVYNTEASAKYIKDLLKAGIDTKAISSEVLSCRDINYSHTKTLIPESL